MISENITNFIKIYSPNSRDSIRFAWNQQHAADFVDENDSFRQQVIAAVIAEPGKAGIDLVGDLFEAESKWSKEAWCVRDTFSALGSILLNSGGTEQLDRFVEWVSVSMDTYCQCHAMDIDPVMLVHLASEIERRLANATDDKEKAKLEITYQLFTKLKSGDPMQGMFKLGAEELAKVKVIKHPCGLLEKIKNIFKKR